MKIILLSGMVLLLPVLAFTQSPSPMASHWRMGNTDVAIVESISTSSELVEAQFAGKYLYPPVNVLDGNKDTTWAEAISTGPGIGENITVSFTKPVSFNEIQIINGFASGNDLYNKNNRVKRVQITQVDGLHFQNQEFTLNDASPSWQPIKYALPQTARVITFTVLDVYKGYRYDDTCLSDIRFLYNGAVIPYEGVELIRQVQEEAARLKITDSFKELQQTLLVRLGASGVFYHAASEDAFYFNAEQQVQNFILAGRYISRAVSTRKVDDFDRAIDSVRSLSRPSTYRIQDNRIVIHQTVDYISTNKSLLIGLNGEQNIILNGKVYEFIPYQRIDSAKILNDY